MSPPERRLWRYLKMRPGDLKFRKQAPIGPYYLDFYCYSAAVAIEVDGDAHDMGDNPARDERRDAYLAKRGILTLRFLAADIFNQLEAVIIQIEEMCASRTPSTALRAVPLPSKSRGGE
jgi:very-short-patch-repair endonuclease